MGWIFVQNGTNRRLRMPPGTVQVGRAQSAKIKSTNQSVSRVHAEITVEANTGKLSDVVPPPIKVTDRSSTGHTFINGKPSGQNVPAALADGDQLSFGVDPVSYTVQWSPVVLSHSSRLGPVEAQEYEAKARSAGVFLTSDWTRQCTHLLIEQVAITPKLLCCIADGGVPVAASFLDALAASGAAEPGPDAKRHRPRPAAGVDTEYAAELEAFLERPQPRHTLLEHIWIVFGIATAREALQLPLSHAGARVAVSCTSPAEASQASESLRLAFAHYGRPRAIWVVTGMDEPTRVALAPVLQEVGAPCHVVSQKAIVGGILAGDVDVAHTEAVPLSFPTSQGTSPGQQPQAPHQAAPFPETQRQQHAAAAGAQPALNGRRQLPNWAGQPAQANGVAPKPVVKEEDSFPHTQQQQQQQQIGAGAQNRGLGATTAVRPVPSCPPPGGATSSTSAPAPQAGIEAKEADGEKEREKPPRLPPSQGAAAAPAGAASGVKRSSPQRPATSAGPPTAKRGRQVVSRGASQGGLLDMLGAVKEQGESQDKAQEPPPAAPAAVPAGRGQAVRLRTPAAPAPLTLSSAPDGSCVKVEKEEDDKKPDRPGLGAWSRNGGGGFSAGVVSLGDTQWAASQAKMEQQQAQLIESSQVKAEAAGPRAGPSATSSTAPAPAAPPEPPPRVVHPTGVWLQSLGTPKRSEGQPIDSCVVDGMEVHRAIWRPDPALEVVTNGRRTHAAAAAAPEDGGRGRKNFKLFRKAQGQRALGRNHVVPVAPWAPPAPLLQLSEAISSQPLGGDSDSQMLPRLPPGI